jgi:hypothetical protein
LALFRQAKSHRWSFPRRNFQACSEFEYFVASVFDGLRPNFACFINFVFASDFMLRSPGPIPVFSTIAVCLRI